MTEQPTEGLGQWLRERCKEEGLSLRQAATKTGLSHSTIADIIIGGTRVSAETVKKLATGFSENGHYEMPALEDYLLILAGYRTRRPDEKPNQALGQLIDKLSQFDDQQLKLMGHFADFVSNSGVK